MRILHVLFIFLILVAFSSCTKNNKKDLRLVIGFIPHVQFTPLYVGIQKGFFEKFGIQISIHYGFGVDSFGLINSDKADMTLSDSDQLIISSSKGMQLKAFYQYYRQYPASIVTLDSINAPEQLAGKLIGVPDLSGTSYIGLQKFLSYYNLTDSVRIERIGYTQIPSLLSGKVDAAVCFTNNEPIQLRLQNTKLHEWKVSEISPLAGAAFITSSEKIRNDEKIYANFNKALSESIEWVSANPEEALEIAYKEIGSLNSSDKKFWLEVLLETLNMIYGDNRHKPGTIVPDTYSFTVKELKSLDLIDSDTITYEDLCHIIN